MTKPEIRMTNQIRNPKSTGSGVFFRVPGCPASSCPSPAAKKDSRPLGITRIRSPRTLQKVTKRYVIDKKAHSSVHPPSLAPRLRPSPTNKTEQGGTSLQNLAPHPSRATWRNRARRFCNSAYPLPYSAFSLLDETKRNKLKRFQRNSVPDPVPCLLTPDQRPRRTVGERPAADA